MARPTNASPVVGLNSIHDIEDERFVAFFNIVQDAAREDGRIFLLNCGEGNDEFLDDMDVCDLSGWLIRREERDEFEPIWRDGSAWESDELDSRFAFARWSMGEDGNVIIRFEAA